MNGHAERDWTMAASITTTCPRCGTVVLERDDLLLVLDPAADVSWYQFDCFGCACRIVKEAPEAVVSALSFADVPACIVPAEVHERRSGEPAGAYPDRLGADDLLDAVLLLSGTDDVASLAAAGR